MMTDIQVGIAMWRLRGSGRGIACGEAVPALRMP